MIPCAVPQCRDSALDTIRWCQTHAVAERTAAGQRLAELRKLVGDLEAYHAVIDRALFTALKGIAVIPPVSDEGQAPRRTRHHAAAQRLERAIDFILAGPE